MCKAIKMKCFLKAISSFIVIGILNRKVDAMDSYSVNSWLSREVNESCLFPTHITSHGSWDIPSTNQTSINQKE